MYYFSSPQRGQKKTQKKTLYGPFRDENSAKFASYFAQSTDVSDNHAPQLYPFRVNWYDDEEIVAIMEEPYLVAASSVEVRSPSKLRMHTSWVNLFETHPEEGSVSEKAKAFFAFHFRGL